ncbi:hypothetical protein E2C01_004341 [Portunus trituberculatus]|uniref:Secreted protein n=1 Tax=Portunus trituberculatus TaxID=210409 RepID=A0A5B7CQB0_PORTR|nr:hypothetical protein [Portunus trituberculatus]
MPRYWISGTIRHLVLALGARAHTCSGPGKLAGFGSSRFIRAFLGSPSSACCLNFVLKALRSRSNSLGYTRVLAPVSFVVPASTPCEFLCLYVDELRVQSGEVPVHPVLLILAPLHDQGEQFLIRHQALLKKGSVWFNGSSSSVTSCWMRVRVWLTSPARSTRRSSNSCLKSSRDCWQGAKVRYTIPLFNLSIYASFSIPDHLTALNTTTITTTIITITTTTTRTSTARSTTGFSLAGHTMTAAVVVRSSGVRCTTSRIICGTSPHSVHDITK